MKKIISLVVMATMLCTLFAVNVSAAVPFGNTLVDLVPAEDFNDTPADSWTSPSVTHQSATPLEVTVVTDAVRGNVLSINPTSEGDAYNISAVGINSGVITFPDKYEISFFIKSLAPDCGFTFWVGDDGISSKGNGGTIFAMCYDDANGNGNFAKDKWYEFKIAIDKTATPAYTIMKRNVTDGGAWVTCTKSGEHFDGDNKFRIDTNKTIGLDLGFGLKAANWHERNYGFGYDYSDAFEFYLDDVSVTESKEIPSTGVLLAQDYEGTSTALTTVSGGEGKIEVGEADGNKFGKLISNNKYGGFITGMVAAKGTWSDISFNNVTLTFDAAWKNDAGTFSIIIGKNLNDNQIGGTINLNIPNNAADKDKWYTYKVVGSGWGNPNTTSAEDGTYRSAAVYRKEKGATTWTEYTDVTVHYATDAGVAEGNVVIGSYNTKGGTIAAATEYWIDNLTVSKRESYSLPAVEVAGGNLNVTVAYENGGEMAKSTMTPVLATFAGGVLVDVDFDAVAAGAGQVEAELSASVAGANKAEIYIWDGIGTVKPIKAAAIDLSSYLQ